MLGRSIDGEPDGSPGLPRGPQGIDASIPSSPCPKLPFRMWTPCASDLSTLSRIQENGGVTHRIDVDLGELASSVATRLRPQFDDQEVQLRVDTPHLRVTGDPDRLTQVIVNLLGNALSYTPSGGRVEMTGRRRDGQIALEVSDTGRGLSAP